MFVEKYQISYILINTLFSCGWAWVLNFICLKGFLTASWILVLLPYMVVSLFFFLVSRYVDKNLLPNIDKKLAAMDNAITSKPRSKSRRNTKKPTMVTTRMI